MPTYEYKCGACEHMFELEQRMTEKPVKKCPKCKKLKAERLISGGSRFVLKGGNWESDLYSGSSNKGGGDSAAPSSGGGGDD